MPITLHRRNICGSCAISSYESFMISLGRRVETLAPALRSAAGQLRRIRTEGGQPRRRPRPAFVAKKAEEKSEWWIVDGEMHEIGDHIPLRERFVIPRENLPNRRRKQLREQFMRRTRLVLKEAEHEPWCRRYMELYQELRENWERLYWNEGYSKKLAKDHANYDSAEDDDKDFSPYRSRQFNPGQNQVQGFGRNKESDTRERVSQIRDKFEYDREKRMKEKAFAPINSSRPSNMHKGTSREQPFEAKGYFSESE